MYKDNHQGRVGGVYHGISFLEAGFESFCVLGV